jgi:hypothetical protein
VGYSKSVLALILGGLALGLATKREFVGVLPGILVALAALLLLRRRGSLAILKWAKQRLPKLVVLAAIIGFVMVAAIITPLGTSLSGYALNEPDQAERLLHPPLSSAELLSLLDLQRKAFVTSFWGMFGWFTMSEFCLPSASGYAGLLATCASPISLGLETILKLFSVACAIGVARTLIASWKEGRRVQFWLVASYGLMIVAMTVLAFGIALSYFSPTTLPQGRQIFGALVPIAVLFAIGTRAWLPASRFGTWFPAIGIAALLILLDVSVYSQSFASHFVGRF